jgi:cation diffusion facilitator CzcD-associated flavoprotein CzcO
MRVLIVGAGFGGISAAIELQRHGFGDVTILDHAPKLGGTWRDNSYPGAVCDVPSHLYSFSFAQRRDWSRLCSPQQEILDYLHDVAARFGVDGLVVPNTRVVSCAWDDTEQVWRTASDDGRTWESDAIVLATGQLHQPAYPAIDGRDRFAGHSFHSAQWDHDYDMRGKRVAVIGTGASSVQFVPEIAEQAQQLVVFQRTGNWFLPRKNRPYPPAIKAVIEHVPGVQAFRRQFMFNYCESLTFMIRHPRTWGRLGHLRSAAFMRWQLRDRELRRKVWPDYTFGCKRILFSSAFLPALQRPNVEVVTDRIVALSERGVVTADGTEYAVDCIVYGTGFRTNDFMFPMAVSGAGGRALAEEWAGGAHAHLGMTVPGFPSMFVIYGPNTNTSGGSIIAYHEAQSAYVRQALEHVARRGAAGIAVRPEVEAATDADVQGAFAGTAWTRCDSWYRTPDGRIVANWPRYMRDYFERTRTFDPAEFELLEKAA